MANIRGTAGADSLTGTISADSITGLGGNDTIRGGQGNDNLNGGADNDRYVFALGDGNDTIGKNATEHAGDIVQITSTLSENQLRLFRQDNHLVIYYGRDNSIMLADHFLGEATGNAWSKLPTLNVNGFNLSLTGGLALTGTSAAETVQGTLGDDTLTGAAGNDALQGNGGNDRYVFSQGDGQDTITSITGNNGDIIQINGLTADDISLIRDGDALRIYYGALGDSIRLPSFFYREDLGDDMKLGTLIVGTDTINLLGGLPLSGTSADDTLNGSDFDDTLGGGDGGDSISGGAGQDWLYGGDGNDTLDGGLGGDKLYGGRGNDSLYGNGAGNRYYFEVGDGQDSIDPYGYYGDSVEIAGVVGGDIRLMSAGNSLIIHYGSSGDTIRILNQLNPSNSDHKIGNLYYDGGSMSLSYGLPFTGTDASESFGGTRYDDRLTGLGGDDTLDGGRGADLLEGGAGNDSLLGREDNDTLLGGDGHDTLVGIEGDDSLEGGAGDDSLAGHDGWDKLYGGAGNDTLDGGLGGDWLYGGTGNDSLYGNGAGNRYYFAEGDGQDTINPDGYYGDAVEIAGVTGANIRFMSDSSSLIIHYGTSGDTIRIWNQLNPSNTDHKIGNLYYDCGSMSLSYGLPFTGTDASESFGGTRYDDRLTGLGGNDTLNGGRGADTLDGGAGNDNLQGYEDNDSLLGGDGDDTLHGIDGDDTADGGTGNDLVNGHEGHDRLLGGTGNDTLDGGYGVDTLSGGKGNDLLMGGATVNRYLFEIGDGQDTVDVGEGTYYDQITIAGINMSGVRFMSDSSTLVIHYGTGGDTIRIPGQLRTSSDETKVSQLNVDGGSVDLIHGLRFTGTEASESFGGTRYNDTLLGLGGNDTLDGGDWGDVLDGGSGADSLLGYGGDDSMLGGDRWDTLHGMEGNDTLNGGLDNDQMTGGPGDDLYYIDNTGDRTFEYAGGGIDTVISTISHALMAELEHLTLMGAALVGTGNGLANRIMGNDLANTLIGGASADTLDGAAGADSLDGGIGNDSLLGGARWDTLSGGDGNDTLDGGLDNDQMYGGLGDDVYYVDHAGDRVNENAGANEGIDKVYATVTWNMSANIETVEFTGSADASSTGNSLHNTMTGNAGNNTLSGGSGHDTINGGDGNDSIDGGTESDVLDGGNGNDTILGGQRWDTLTGGSGDDVLDGGTENDRMVGNAGNDTYYIDHVGDRVVEVAGEGTDLVYSSIDWAMAVEVENLILTGAAVTATGNGLNNRILGNANANVLNGGNGNDTITGGAGADTLTGGTGRDDFVFNAAASNGTDRISDFATTIDRLVFKGSDYGFAAGHSLTAAQFTLGASAVGTGAQFGWDAAAGHLWWDADGTGTGSRVDLGWFDGAPGVTKEDLYFTA